MDISFYFEGGREIYLQNVQESLLLPELQLLADFMKKIEEKCHVDTDKANRMEIYIEGHKYYQV